MVIITSGDGFPYRRWVNFSTPTGVINFKFSPQPRQKYNITQHEELSLLNYKILPILTTSLYTFLFKRMGECWLQTILTCSLAGEDQEHFPRHLTQGRPQHLDHLGLSICCMVSGALEGGGLGNEYVHFIPLNRAVEWTNKNAWMGYIVNEPYSFD